ncbi:MAG: M48 family metallopeptidase [Proteobacteria bacterium]|nr:M48 family metallopeptidase [Pseudomonadota bacterium]
MIEFRGNYFDGQTSRSYTVTVKLAGQSLSIRGEGLKDIVVPLVDCEITPALGQTTRSILLPGGARCDTDEFKSVAVLERLLGLNPGMRIVNLLESHWQLVAVCFVGLILCTWLFISHGIPVIAKKAAAAIPPKVTEKISLHTLEFLDKNYLAPTKLSENRARELEETFQMLVAGKGKEFDFRLEFREGKIIGANAFALPSGLILMTDELVDMSESDAELIGILYHEITHVEKRHGMRSVFQNAGVFLLVSALAGDIASITSVASTLPTVLAQTGYSRNFEREADEAAGLYMMDKGWGTKPLQDILLRLTKRGANITGMSLISTHPETDERVHNLKLLED